MNIDAIAVAHILTLLGVWLIAGEINPLLLKVMALMWLILIFFSFITTSIKKHQQVNYFKEIQDVNVVISNRGQIKPD